MCHNVESYFRNHH